MKDLLRWALLDILFQTLDEEIMNVCFEFVLLNNDMRVVCIL